MPSSKNRSSTRTFSQDKKRSFSGYRKSSSRDSSPKKFNSWNASPRKPFSSLAAPLSDAKPHKSRRTSSRLNRAAREAAAKNSDTPNTSWQGVSEWYNSNVGGSGHYYHEHVVIPESLKLLNLNDRSSVLDLACGQGVLARHLSEKIYYQGLDIAPSLIEFAKEKNEIEKHYFNTADVARSTLPILKKDFTHATVILALQNIEHPERVFRNAAAHLVSGGKLLIILNHPYYRIPRQSSWGIDQEKKTQYRRVDRYLSPLKVPITAHPGRNNSTVTWSFHQPLSSYTRALQQHGFVIELIDEWSSDKQSVGKAAKMENRSRQEFPLFMAVLAKKQ